jgi:hypothetical protein
MTDELLQTRWKLSWRIPDIAEIWNNRELSVTHNAITVFNMGLAA